MVSKFSSHVYSPLYVVVYAAALPHDLNTTVHSTKSWSHLLSCHRFNVLNPRSMQLDCELQKRHFWEQYVDVLLDEF